jgi:hypothetical protein
MLSAIPSPLPTNYFDAKSIYCLGTPRVLHSAHVSRASDPDRVGSAESWWHVATVQKPPPASPKKNTAQFFSKSPFLFAIPHKLSAAIRRAQTSSAALVGGAGRAADRPSGGVGRGPRWEVAGEHRWREPAAILLLAVLSRARRGRAGRLGRKRIIGGADLRPNRLAVLFDLSLVIFPLLRVWFRRRCCSNIIIAAHYQKLAHTSILHLLVSTHTTRTWRSVSQQ